MLNVESILLNSMLLFNTVGQLFHKVLLMDVHYCHEFNDMELLQYIKVLEHSINIDLNSWFTDSQKTFSCFVVCYYVPILSSSLDWFSSFYWFDEMIFMKCPPKVTTKYGLWPIILNNVLNTIAYSLPSIMWIIKRSYNLPDMGIN